MFGLPPLPHQRQGLWTAICSSLRNSSSQTSGSWLAKPEWKISGANGVAMQKREPRTQLWSGFAALAGLVKHSSLTFPHMLSAGLPTPTLLSSAKHLQTHSFKSTPDTPLWGEGCGTEQILWENLETQHPADFYRPESTILVLKWVSHHHLLLHVILLVFWQRVKTLLPYIQCANQK